MDSNAINICGETDRDKCVVLGMTDISAGSPLASREGAPLHHSTFFAAVLPR